jgi:alpha-galactosidase
MCNDCGKFTFGGIIGLYVLTAVACGQSNILYLDDVATSEFTVTQGFGTSMRNLSIDGNSLQIAGQSFDAGIGTHAGSYWGLNLGGSATRFQASVGVDDEVGAGHGSVEFKVVGNGKVLWDSGLMSQGDAAQEIDVDLSGVQRLHLFVTDGGDGINYDHADWANARITSSSTSLLAQRATDKYLLTPAPGVAPRINSPQLFGVRPGSPFLFQVAATGDKTGIAYSASGLPAGLAIDQSTGSITGAIADPTKKSYDVELQVSNSHGTANQALRIQVGDDIQLTPAMGWNTWYNYSEALTEEGIRAQAQAMHDSGLVDHGWTYINMDDCWQGPRAPVDPNDDRVDLALQGKERFGNGHETSAGDGNLSGMVDFIHGLGLKAGIYSTPWVGSYAGFRGGSADNPDGTYNDQIPLENRIQPNQIYGRSNGAGQLGKHYVGSWFMDRDAQQWADWGIDYVKVDWNPNDVALSQQILDNLKQSGRDIVLSLSNSAPMSAVSGGIDELANSWRTGGDIGDTWSSISRGFNQDSWARFASPGHFNDPDILQLGMLGHPNRYNDGPEDLNATRLTPNEQYTHVSLWAMLSAPLMIGGDLTQLDPFTLNLLTNDEVIAVNQDPIGSQATRERADGDFIVMGKQLQDGSLALGIFNTGTVTALYDLDLGQLPIFSAGGVELRDLWRQVDLGAYQESFETAIESHGVMLLRVTSAARFGDLDSNDLINQLDWMRFKSGQGTSFAGLTKFQAYQLGDLDGDFDHDLDDFSLFRSAFEEFNGVGSFSAMLTSIPEPRTACLVLSAAATSCVCAGLRRRRTPGADNFGASQDNSAS